MSQLRLFTMRFSQAVRIGARSSGLPRQSQNPCLQAEPRIFCRRYTPLTPPPARAGFFAKAHAASGKIMSAAVVIALLVPFAANAQTATEHRLLAETIPLTDSPANNPQLAIWRDQIPNLISDSKDLQRRLTNGTIKPVAEVFTTSFVIDGHTYFVSAIHSNCGSSSAAPNSLFCPTRIAEVANGQARLVGEIPQLLISSVRGNAGYDATSNAQSRFMTIAAYDPKTRTISFADVENGERTPFNNAISIR
jgi:hypothetical protein